jgi:hypothetical protein
MRYSFPLKAYSFSFYIDTVIFFSISFLGLVKFAEYLIFFEELGGRAVSALGVRSRKLSTGLNGQSWDG